MAFDQKTYMREYERTRIRPPDYIEKRRAYDRERHRKYMNEWRKKKGELYRHRWWAGNLRRVYGLTEEQFNNMREAQENKCAVCQIELQKSGADRLVIDHCHQTKTVRGLLCCACNRTIGHAKEDPKRLRACALYLERV